MLRLELVEESEMEVIYNYFPEQSDTYGIITVNKISSEIVVVKTASGDAHKRYLHHAVARIEKYVTNKCYLESDIVTWY